MLRINNLTLELGDQTLVSGLQLEVAEGDIVTLTGVSGSGKSTLLNWLSASWVMKAMIISICCAPIVNP